MDQYLQCIYVWLEEEEIQRAVQGEKEYADYRRNAEKKKDSFWNALTGEQQLQLEQCCSACMLMQSSYCKNTLNLASPSANTCPADRPTSVSARCGTMYQV